MDVSAAIPAAASGEASSRFRTICSREACDGAVAMLCEPSTSRSSRSPPWITSSGIPAISSSTPAGTPRAVADSAHRPSGSGSRSMLGTIVSQNAVRAARRPSSSLMFMQPGFMLLEIGFSRMKNAGTIVPKVLANFSIAAIGYWAIGFALAFGGSGWFAGTHGPFLDTNNGALFPAMAASAATVPSKWFFQFVFCAVSLAIVWGTTIERIKFGAYLIYAVIFSTLIYPIVSHWIFGGGWLFKTFHMQDFAGSTVVHLIGATGAFAALLLLGPRQGKYGPDGKPNVIPGHSMPLVGLAVLILWFGWFGFNPGSTLSAISGPGRFAEVAVVTNLAAAAGVLGAMATIWLITRTFDMGMTCNGAIAALVAITAPSGYVEFWAAPIIGFLAGVIVVVSVILIDRKIDDPVGALSAHGMAGIWGTLSCGLFTSPRLAAFNANGHAGLVYHGDFHQLGAQALGVTAAFTA